MDNLRRYFDMLRCAAFMEAHVSALEKFVQRVDDYRNTSLVQLCRAMDELDREFAEGGIANTVTASDLFDLASIQPQLDANFAAKNANDEIGRDFLTQLADVSFAAVPNPNPFSGGLSFTFASTRLSSIRAALREQLEDCFGNVNNASMDDILEQQVGTDPALQHAAMDALGAAIRGSADPLFSINPAMTGIHGAEFTYLSIPEDSQNYFDYFTQTFNDVTPKSSSLLDHIFCLTTYDGMPACLYSQMDDIEQVYANSLTNAAQSMGRHLVWSGDLNDDVTRNWTKLPSPRPYFLFGPTGQLSEQKKFEAALATLDRAIACGMISIDDSSPNPSYTVRMKYTTGGVAVVRTSALIRSEVDAIDAMKDPATQMALTETQKLPHLQQYQSDVTENVIVDTCNAVCMAQYLGLTDQPTDPFAKGIEANPVVMEQAKRNHHNLCHALVAAYLYSDPVTWLSIDNQLEGMEYLQERINTIVAQQNRWQIRETSAPQVAELLIHKYITIDTGKAMYDMNGQNFSLYTPQLMKVDVKGLSDYAKCAAYFGDLPAGNPARTHLENMLNLKNLQLDDAILNGTINPMKPAIHAAADGLLQKLDNEIGKYRSALMQPNADRELIANILNVLTAMKSTAETIKHNYRPATPPSGNPSPV